MPRLAPEKRGSGTWAPHPDGRPPLPRPDQSRYGPKRPHEPGQTGIRHSQEGGGIVTTCRVCGWERWHETPAEAHRIAAGHTCRSGDRCLVCGPPTRLEDLDCPHLMTKAKAKALAKDAGDQQEHAHAV